jgi:glycosyltransferase involved in cell wall biosynthesis
MTVLQPAPAELGVLLTPRELGGHEAALFGWLADAARLHGLRLQIAATTPALAGACASAGLADQLWPGLPADTSRSTLLQLLRRWPTGQPLLLAPGVLHAGAWLLAAAVARGHEVWVYLPMAYSARHMGYRHAGLRDALLAPWLRRVRLWITVDAAQRRWLHRHWRLPAPVLVLPNLPRLPPQPAPLCQPAPDARLRVAWVGRFDLWQKGLDWLAGLLRHDPHWHQHYRWHFQGRGPGEPALQALASALGPQHALVHPHAPLQQALACSDVLLLPSRYEGTPLVALEATALGWPVVASRQAGLAALLPPASLFTFGDAQGLHQALAQLRQPAARAQAVVHAQQQLARLHTPQHYRPALAALVQHLRSGRHAGASAGRGGGPC